MTTLLDAQSVVVQTEKKDLSPVVLDFRAAVEASVLDYPASIEACSREMFSMFLGNPDPKLISKYRAQILSDFNCAVDRIGVVLIHQSNERKKDEIVNSLWAVLSMKKLFQILCDNGADSVKQVLREVERSKDKYKVFDWNTETRSFKPVNGPS